MEGGIGALILVVVAGGAVTLLMLNAWWKSPRLLLQEARPNIAGAAALVSLALARLSTAEFVIPELL